MRAATVISHASLLSIRPPSRSAAWSCAIPASRHPVPSSPVSIAARRARLRSKDAIALASPGRQESTAAMSDPLPIIVYSDVICPWCYVGKRRLEAALASPGMPATGEFSWRPFELNPDMPAEGMERKVYRARKFGEARSAELDVQHGRDRPRARHRVRLRSHAAHAQHAPGPPADLGGRAARAGQDAIVERLFHGYFEKGSISAPPRSWKASPRRPGSTPTGWSRR